MSQDQSNIHTEVEMFAAFDMHASVQSSAQPLPSRPLPGTAEGKTLPSSLSTYTNGLSSEDAGWDLGVC